jgi:hypothetical protein
MTAPAEDAQKPRRRNHRWGFIEKIGDGSWSITCNNCGLVERHAYFLSEPGQTVDVMQWITPNGRLLRIRPLVDIRPDRKGEQRIEDAFPGVEVGNSPECPKDPAAWT